MEVRKSDLPSHLAKAKEIAIDGLDHSSVFECLETKVGENTKLKEENLSLLAQIKIITESMKLQEAEFAFQRSEFEQEIQMYKKNEENLKQSLLKFETHVPIEIEVYQKFQELQINYDNALKRIQELEDESQKQKFQNKYNKLRTAYQELQASIPKFQKKIERRNKAIEDLTHQIQQRDEEMNNMLKNSGLSSSSSSSGGQISIQKMNQKYQRQAAKLQQLEARNAELEKKLSHCESEFEVLSDILDIKTPIQEEWIDIRQKIKTLIDNGTVNDISNENNKNTDNDNNLNNYVDLSPPQVNNSLNVQKEQNNKEKNSENQEDLLNEINELKMQLHKITSSYEREKQFEPQQRIRLFFVRTIAKNYSFLVDKLSKLHNVMFESEQQELRPLVLMSIFLIRWLKIKQHTVSNDFDEISLFSLSTSSKITFSEKIDQMQSKYVELTNDLINTKKSLIEYQQKVELMQSIIDQNEANTEGQRNELKAAKETIDALREYSNSIQEELALAVPPLKFEETLTKMTDLELEIDILSSKVKKLTDEMEDKDILIQDLTREIKENDYIKESKDAEISDIRKISEKRCHEIEVLKAKLKDKTKELLALERLIHQTNPLLLNSTTVSDENQESNVINPAFLGNNSK